MLGRGVTTKRVNIPKDVPLVVRPKPGFPKERRFVGLSGWRTQSIMGVHNHNLTNVLRGLVERVYKVEGNNGLQTPPRPVEGAFDRLSNFRQRLLRKIHCRMWSYDELLLSYTGAKKLRMQEAIESLSVRGVQRTDAVLRTFVKAEKINFTSKPDPAPRVIQPRDPRYNAAVGRYLKAVEHPVYAAIAEVWGGPTVMKGYNASEVAANIVDAWGQFRVPVAIGLDASRFDQHVSAAALRWEHTVYNAIFRSRELQRLLEWQIDNRGKAYTPDGVVSYRVEGCRMSGDMNTALGNCLIMCGLVWEMCNERKIRARLINNGDDCVLICEKSDLQRLPNIKKWFLEFGFNMKQEPTVDILEKIEFCQMHPVYDGNAWVMCRSPNTGLMKDLTNIRPQMREDGSIDTDAFARWCGAVGTAGLSLAAGIPIFDAHYKAMLRFGAKGGRGRVAGFGDNSTGFEWLCQRMDRHAESISDSARVSFWRAFGITPGMQVAVEEHIRSVTSWRVKSPTASSTIDIYYFD